MGKHAIGYWLFAIGFPEKPNVSLGGMSSAVIGAANS
jgi:hypothetical protein